MDLGKAQLNTIYSSLFMILKCCKVQKTDIQWFFKLSLLLSCLKFVESRLHVILRPMYAGYLSILRTNDFRCVFRYYYGVNVNTDIYIRIISAKFGHFSRRCRCMLGHLHVTFTENSSGQRKNVCFRLHEILKLGRSVGNIFY